MSSENKKTVEKKFCRKCGFGMWPKVDDDTNEIKYPQHCRKRDCKLPDWDQPYK